jgi:hypothetical protein
MIFQCDDLDLALQFEELMPDAEAHAANCLRCREQLDVWKQLSSAASQLHEEWDSPDLWARIQSRIAQTPARSVMPVWRWALAAAAALAVAGLLWQTALRETAPERDLLTEQALHEVQQNEAAYAQSIEKLSVAARRSLERSTTPLAGACRDKLTVLDSAIADLKSTIETNPYNAYLQTQLASLYRAKQQTLQEWMQHAKTI